jgi:hypothetical protein
MNENKNYSVVDKSDMMPCWKCETKGIINGEICPLCFGDGKFKESHYIIIDEVNKIACDSDTDG